MKDQTSPEEFGLLFKRFLDDIVNRAEVPEGPLLRRLRDHLGGEPMRMPVIAEEFERFEQPNLQVAMDAYLERPGRSAELIGLAAENKRAWGIGPQSIIQSHRLPAVARDDVVLPPGVLERIERHAVTFSEHAERLVAAGRPIKRGLLLYGAPGTGKTLTVMYLAGRMHGRTLL